MIKPFVGNKRTEITSNPIIYFIDNGFRNCALNNFLDIDTRSDAELLIENFVFQEILKLKLNSDLKFDMFYWRTKSGTEVDFVLKGQSLLPIEVKYRNFDKPVVSKSFRSFLTAYAPLNAIILTKNYTYQIDIGLTKIYFISLDKLDAFLSKIVEVYKPE